MIAHFEVLKPELTVNPDFYCAQINRVNQSLMKKGSEITNRKDIILQHDSARSALRKKNPKIIIMKWEALPHPHCAVGFIFILIQNATSKYVNQKEIDFSRPGIEILCTRGHKFFDNEGDYNR